jgi:hypothetical protein
MLAALADPPAEYRGILASMTPKLHQAALRQVQTVLAYINPLRARQCLAACARSRRSPR